MKVIIIHNYPEEVLEIPIDIHCHRDLMYSLTWRLSHIRAAEALCENRFVTKTQNSSGRKAEEGKLHVVVSSPHDHSKCSVIL